jgi:hypothetical protein
MLPVSTLATTTHPLTWEATHTAPEPKPKPLGPSPAMGQRLSTHRPKQQQRRQPGQEKKGGEEAPVQLLTRLFALFLLSPPLLLLVLLLIPSLPSAAATAAAATASPPPPLINAHLLLAVRVVVVPSSTPPQQQQQQQQQQLPCRLTLRLVCSSPAARLTQHRDVVLLSPQPPLQPAPEGASNNSSPIASSDGAATDEATFTVEMLARASWRCRVSAFYKATGMRVGTKAVTLPGTGSGTQGRRNSSRMMEVLLSLMPAHTHTHTHSLSLSLSLSSIHSQAPPTRRTR